jgi:hypothetical protein
MKASDKILERIGISAIEDNIEKKNYHLLMAIVMIEFYLNKGKLETIEVDDTIYE